MRDATGTQLAMLGREGRLRKTAAEALQLMNEGHEFNRDNLRIVEIDALHERGNMIVNMERQLTTEPVYGMIMGLDKAKVYMEIRPKEIDWRGGLRIQAASLYGNKQVVAQSRMQFAELMSGVQAAQGMINWPELIRRIAESLDIIPDNLIIMPEDGATAQPAAPPAPAMPGGPAAAAGLGALQPLGAPVPMLDSSSPMTAEELAMAGEMVRAQGPQRPMLPLV